jgi:hypothetical protein
MATVPPLGSADTFAIQQAQGRRTSSCGLVKVCIRRCADDKDNAERITPCNPGIKSTGTNVFPVLPRPDAEDAVHVLRG